MSYILEALKKSEQERRRGEVPEINRFDSPAEESHTRTWFWPVVVALLVVVNVIVLIVWAPWEAPESPAPVSRPFAASQQAVVDPIATGVTQSPAASTSAGSPAVSFADSDDRIKVAPARLPEVAQRQPVQPPAARQPVDDVVTTAEPEIIRPRSQRQSIPGFEAQPEFSAEAEIIRPYSVPQASYLPQLQELPADMQRRVPDMSFSSHMYSSEPRFRSIIINGKRLKEGHYLSDDIQVREITDKGVILSLDGTVFEVDVLGQWVN